jgi:hypothetical protein
MRGSLRELSPQRLCVDEAVRIAACTLVHEGSARQTPTPDGLIPLASPSGLPTRQNQRRACPAAARRDTPLSATSPAVVYVAARSALSYCDASHSLPLAKRMVRTGLAGLYGEARVDFTPTMKKRLPIFFARFSEQSLR